MLTYCFVSLSFPSCAAVNPSILLYSRCSGLLESDPSCFERKLKFDSSCLVGCNRSIDLVASSETLMAWSKVSAAVTVFGDAGESESREGLRSRKSGEASSLSCALIAVGGFATFRTDDLRLGDLLSFCFFIFSSRLFFSSKS